jgi:hypothetical protein
MAMSVADLPPRARFAGATTGLEVTPNRVERAAC